MTNIRGTEQLSSANHSSEQLIANNDPLAEINSHNQVYPLVSSSQPTVVRILLVEANPSDFPLVRETLAETVASRFKLTPATCLRESLAHLTTEADFDLVLFDLSLPDQNGLETMASLHRAAPNLPIIVLTSTDDPVLAREALQHGAQDYLVKDQMTSAFWLK